MSGVETWIALGILLALIQSGVIVAVAGYAVAPEPAARLLQSFQGWLVRHSRILGIVLGFGIGAAFVFAGVTQITG